MYIEGNSKLWPKGAFFAKPGKLTIHIGPVQQPTSIAEIYKNYTQWVKSIDPSVLPDDMTDENVVSEIPVRLADFEGDDDDRKTDGEEI